jgi:hypothetical protein
MWLDYTQLRTVMALAGLTIITVLVVCKDIGDTAYATCFCAIFGCFTAHSLLDDKFPDRNP